MPNLYVTEPGSMVKKEGGRLVVAKGGEVLLEIPAIHVENVVVLAGAGITTPALNFLLARGIGLVLLSASGAFRGRLSGDLAKNVSLRRQQYRRADHTAFSLGIARSIVAGKLANCRVRCLEMAKAKEPPVAVAVEGLQRLISRAAAAGSRAELMGIEGQGTQHYFAVVRHVLRPPWVFERRARRPPPDPVNSLLSLLSTFLHGTCYGALEAVGLDPYCGFLHEERYGRASLALDLMEEFRPILADAMVLALLHKRMLRPGDFALATGGGVRLTTDGWRVVTTQYHRRLQERVRPERGAAAIPYQQVIEHQARRLRAVIEGTEAVYVPYRAR
jgi:CRISPR-associated protein Cas1